MPEETTPHLQGVLDRLGGVRRCGGSNQWEARCPAHEDEKPSLAISLGQEGRVLLHCHAGCKLGAITSAIGIQVRDLWPREHHEQANPAKAGHPPSTSDRCEVYADRDQALQALNGCLGCQPSGEWRYRDRDGQAVLVVVRFDPPETAKTYRCMSPNGEGWLLRAPKEPLPLYRLPQLPEEGHVFLVEGEKVADAAAGIGLPATTSAFGAKSPHKTDWSPLSGREVVILPDNDAPGREYARQVDAKLRELEPPARVTIRKLDGLAEGEDLADWIEQRGERGQELGAVVRRMAEQAGTSVEADSPLLFRPISEIETEEMRFLWPGRIPLGKITMMVGDPGTGKSMVSLHVAACVSKGNLFPDGRPPGVDPGSTIILSAEDGPGDTIRPRLEAMGAELGRIHVIPEGQMMPDEKHIFNLREHLEALEAEIRRIGDVRLVVVDPVNSYMGGKDSNKNEEVRGILEPLRKLAQACGFAVLCIGHLNKDSKQSVQHRSSGSIAWIAVARAAYLLGKVPGDPETLVLAPLKYNLGPEPPSLSFRVEDGYPRWQEGDVDISAGDLVSEAKERGGRRTLEAENCLRAVLAKGPVPAAQVFAEAKRAGIAEKTVRRAAENLSVTKKKERFQGPSIWSLRDAGSGGGLENDSTGTTGIGADEETGNANS